MKLFYLVSCFILFSIGSLSQSIKLSDYGIVPGDKLDDSAPINSLIEQYKGANLVLDFSQGVYQLDKPLRIIRQASLQLKEGTIIQANNPLGGILVFSDGFSMEGGKMICKPADVSDFNQGFGILLQGVSNARISNVEFSKFSGTGILLLSDGNKGCKKNVIRNNSFIQPDKNGMKYPDKSAILLGYSGSNYSHDDNIIENNIIQGDYGLQHGIALIGHGNNNLIKYNTITECASYGIVLYEIISVENGYTINNNQLVSNKISGVGNKKGAPNEKGMGIYLMKTKGTLVIDNSIMDAVGNNGPNEPLPPGAIAMNTALDCTIRSNTIVGSGKYGIMGVYCSNLIIEENSLSNNGNVAIYLNFSNSVKVSENKIISDGKEAVKFRFGNTSLVNLPKEAFKSEFYRLETGKDIIVENNNIEVENANQVVFIDPDQQLSDSSRISIINNKIKSKNNRVMNPVNKSNTISIKGNVFN